MFKLGGIKRKNQGNDSESQNLVPGRGGARANEKIAKRILGKSTGRRVFGFACSPGIQAQLKVLAGEFQIPMFALAEHCLQLGVDHVTQAKESPEEIETLRKHLLEVHVAQRSLEKISWYDEKLAKKFNEERLGRLAIEQGLRELIVNFVHNGMKPQDIGWYCDYGYRCFSAVLWGRPVPRDIPPWAPSRQKSRSPNNPPLEKMEDETANDDDDAPE